MNRKTPESIEFQLEELKLIYENLQNALSAQKNTFHIFTLIATAVIASLGGALSSEKFYDEHSLLKIGFIPIVLCVVFPLISYCFCGMWLGEVKRMLRSGNYIDYKSKLMQEKYHYDIWNFENYNKGLGQIKVPYVLHFLYFVGCAIISLILGILYLKYINLDLDFTKTILCFIFNGTAIIFCVLYCVNILNETKKCNMSTITVLNTRQSKYAICIPVVNEGNRLKKQLLEMKRLRIYEQADIIICDGNSVDGSTDIDFLRQVKVFALIKYSKAHQSEQLLAGFKFVLKHNYLGLITVDGNGKDSIKDIKQFIHELQQEEVDFIQGSRYCQGGEAINTPFIRECAIKFHVWAINKIVKREPKFTDTTNGFRAFKTKIISEHEELLERQYSNHAMVYHLLVIATKYNYKEIPVKREYPRKGRATKIIPVLGHIELFFILFNLWTRKFFSKKGVMSQGS